MALPGGSDGKGSPENARNPGSTSGWGRPSKEGNGSPLQYSCLENSVTEEPRDTVLGVTKSQTRLSDKHLTYGISLAIQWLRCHTSISEAAGSIPVHGTKIPHALLRGCTRNPPKKKKMCHRNTFHSQMMHCFLNSALCE